MGEEGGRGLISAALLARACDTRSGLGLNSCWPHSRVLAECLFSPPSTFLCVAWSCTVVDKNAHTIGAIHPYTYVCLYMCEVKYLPVLILVFILCALCNVQCACLIFTHKHFISLHLLFL